MNFRYSIAGFVEKIYNEKNIVTENDNQGA
jgi:hypothetical protein